MQSGTVSHLSTYPIRVTFAKYRASLLNFGPVVPVAQPR
ncbi:hypothetical protein FTUN_0888 [Frigoriglobus tundricola]|uniref:Uncharacterized protein n=1 Tax=Frigoriglobus tundricola TaxID=2774151 RepID=A0A6M5YK73_9BACT|nr:hypothetical protein FTUN_0888 [Frigoriglobus tundricola]